MYSPDQRGPWLVVKQTAGGNSKARIAISTQGLALSPPELALHKQPAFFLHTVVEEQQQGNATVSPEGCRGDGGPRAGLSGGTIRRGSRAVEKCQRRQVQAARWQPRQGSRHR